MKFVETSAIFEILEEYEKLEDPTSKQLMEIIDMVYIKIIYNKFHDFKFEEDSTLDDINDISDLILDVADSLAVTLIRWHSKDVTDMPYQIPSEKINRLKKHFYRILCRQYMKKEILNELFRLAFVLAYVPSVARACSHRKDVIEEKLKRQNPKDN